MTDAWDVRFAGRADGVIVRGPLGTLHFGAALHEGTWTVSLPPHDEAFRPRELTPEEQAEVFPRVERLLCEDRVLGLPLARYAVRFLRERRQ